MIKVGDYVARMPVTFGRSDEEDQRKNNKAAMRGKVVYIHPKGRYHTVEFMVAGGTVRECFLGVE